MDGESGLFWAPEKIDTRPLRLSANPEADLLEKNLDVRFPYAKPPVIEIDIFNTAALLLNPAMRRLVANERSADGEAHLASYLDEFNIILAFQTRDKSKKSDSIYHENLHALMCQLNPGFIIGRQILNAVSRDPLSSTELMVGEGLAYWFSDNWKASRLFHNQPGKITQYHDDMLALWQKNADTPYMTACYRGYEAVNRYIGGMQNTGDILGKAFTAIVKNPSVVFQSK